MLPKRFPVIIVLLGFLAVLAVAIVWAFYLSPVARIGRNAGFNPPTYVVVRTIEHRAADHHTLSAPEVATVRALANDKDPAIRARALTALFYLGATEHASTACEIARAHVNDPEPLVRQYALSALFRLKSPDVSQVAKAMLNDPAGNVRQKAKTVLGSSQPARAQ